VATWTAAQLADGTLRALGIVGAGQVASAEDTALVAAAYVSAYPRLRRLGLAPWASATISEEAQQPLAKHLAGEVAVAFGFTGDRLAALKMEAASGWAQLQEVAAGDRHMAPKRIVDF
jgi:hypothetical protein